MSTQVHRIPMGLAPGYLVETDGGLLLVDAGSVYQEHRVTRAMQRLGRDDLRLIFVTHAHLDHYGSAAALRQLTGAPIAVHKLDADPMTCGETPIGSPRLWQGRTLRLLLRATIPTLQPQPTRPDILLEDGDQLEPFGLDATVVHTPGHTFGSATLILQDQVAFAGDLMSNTGYPHAQQFLAEDWAAIPASIDQVQSRQPAWTYTGHSHRPLSEQQLQRLRR